MAFIVAARRGEGPQTGKVLVRLGHRAGNPRASSLPLSRASRYDAQRDRALSSPRGTPMSEPLPADLTRVDPAQAWEAWKPEPRDPFDARWAAHLFRRAAFGASPERVARAVRDGVEPTVAELLRGS